MILATVVLALAAGWFTVKVSPPTPPVHTYVATTTMINTGGGIGVNTLAAMVQLPNIAIRVAKDLHSKEDPYTLISQIQASADPESGLLNITATSTDRAQAKALSDSFARELVGFLSSRQSTTRAQQTEALNQQLKSLTDEIHQLDQKMPSASGTAQDLLISQRNAKIQLFGALQTQYQEALTAPSAGTDPTNGLLLLQEAVPHLSDVQGFQAPNSRKARLLIAGIMGLLAGLALALILERVDTRIRTRQAAERFYGLPVIGEIPSLSKWPKRKHAVAAAQPNSQTSHSFRLLVAGLLRLREGEGNGVESNGHKPDRTSQTIMVTSATPSEGKSTVVANLAASFSETGKRVLILSCDFLRPSVHRMFEVPNDFGLANGLESANGSTVLNGHVQETKFKGISIVPSGVTTRSSSELLSSEAMRTALAEAREMADIVLLDTSPILTAGDAVQLLHEVDQVLVVGRAGKTTADVAERTGEMLKRLGAPVVGVALNDASYLPTANRYYLYVRMK